jgi:hypothetical protein
MSMRNVLDDQEIRRISGGPKVFYLHPLPPETIMGEALDVIKQGYALRRSSLASKSPDLNGNMIWSSSSMVSASRYSQQYRPLGPKPKNGNRLVTIP